MQMSIALSWYGCYLFSIDTPSARLALDSARLAARRRDRAVVGRDRRGSRRSEEDANSYQEGRTQSLHTDVPVFFLPLPCFAFRRRTTRSSLVSQDFSNKLLRSRWFAGTNVLIPLLETKFFKSWRRQEPWSLLILHRKPFLVSSSFWQLLKFPHTWSQHSHACPIFA